MKISTLASGGLARSERAATNNRPSTSTSFSSVLERTSHSSTVSAQQAREILRLLQDVMEGMYTYQEDDRQFLESFAFIRPFTHFEHELQPAPGSSTLSLQPQRPLGYDPPVKNEQQPAQEAATSQQHKEPADIERLIEQVAQQVGLPVHLIRSVVRAESSFRPDAVSPVGAQGLMQLMPGTAQEMGVEDSFDPRQNLLGGSRYLKRLLHKYDGHLDSALAAYNWGQGNVDRKGLEQMPAETRDYIAKVKRNV